VIKIPIAPAAFGVSLKNNQPKISARIGRIAFKGPNTDKSAARNAASMARLPSASKTPPSKLSTQNEPGGRTHIAKEASSASGNISP
jgi:hypothetical protein